MIERMPTWVQEWIGVIVPLSHVALIFLVAWVTRGFARRLIHQLGESYSLPPEVVVGARRVSSFLIGGAALLLILERLGVSGTVLWTAFTGFAAVGAVAFFAAWSVLSNIFCTILILTTRPFRINDRIELIENGEKPGLKGQVVDINLIYTTLREEDESGGGSLLQIPNNLFFQRSVRRWRSAEGLKVRGEVGPSRVTPTR